MLDDKLEKWPETGQTIKERCHCGCHGNRNDNLIDSLHFDHGMELVLTGEIPKEACIVWQEFITGQSWTPGLEFVDLRAGGHLTYYSDSLTPDKYMIMDYEEEKVISFNWLDSAIVTIEFIESAVDLTSIILTYWTPEGGETLASNLLTWMIALKKLATIIQGGSCDISQADKDFLYKEIQAKIEALATRKY